MQSTGYLTPDNVPEGEHCRVFVLPNNEFWIGNFMGALLPLTYPTSWREYGELTPEECAEIMLNVIWASYEENAQICEMVDAPFYDSEESADDEEPVSEQPWYNEISDWIIEAYLAVTFTPAAAVAYEATIPKIRIALQKGNLGDIVNVVFGAVDILYDLANPTSEIVYLTLDSVSGEVVEG